MSEFKIVFLGICCFVHMVVGGQDAKRVVLPNLSDGAGGVGRHVAFVMIPEGAYVSNDNWGVPFEVVNEDQTYLYFALNGDEVTFNEEADPFFIQDGYENNVPKLKDYCSTFDDFADTYLFGNDPATKIAQVDLSHGSLRARTMFSGMIGSELSIRVPGNLVVTATSFESGATRRLRVSPGAEVWIGNMTKAFLRPDADHNAEEIHFRAYYRMSDQPLTCDRYPGQTTPSEHVHGEQPESDGEVWKDFNVTCSNSNYP